VSFSRLDQLRLHVADDACILISHPINVRYLCGYTGSNGLLLSTPDKAYLFTDTRYEIQCEQECFDVEVVMAKAGLLVSALEYLTCNELSIEAAHMSVATREAIASAKPEVNVKNTRGLVEGLRVVKDAGELELISAACAISVAALEQVATYLRPGLSEREIAQHLEHTMLQLGADDKAFESIVATGSNTAIPHHQPTKRVVESGDLIKIDFGAKLDGYHADCTRMFVAGQPAEWQTELHSVVRECQQMARETLRSGVLAAHVDATARDFMKSHGKGHLFTHGLGHGVGLEIHEDPFFSRQPTTTIVEGTIVTIEPGAYIRDQGGVRIEDTVVVTEVGYKNLTNFTYDLVTIG